MPIVLYRVDERLIHGQVVVGWGSILHPDRIIVVDDELASSAWEQELYAFGLSGDVAAEFCTVEEARPRLAEWRGLADRVVVLTRDLETMRRLAQGGTLRGEEVNVGGIHYAPGRRSVLPYLYLSRGEQEELCRLADEGVTVSARDLPSGRRVDLKELLRTGDRDS